MNERTEHTIDLFRQISRIPRCSRNEEAIGRWLRQWAENLGFETQVDGEGNLVVRIPATAGYENAPVVILQGHMDMVCEKTPESSHDFSADPIRVVVDGDWLKAESTTLGADNGIGLAIAMSIATDPDVSHPPLELLFTVDEETGLNGARKLGREMIRGQILINIDSEDEGVFTIGCAGGRDTRILLPLSPAAPVPDGFHTVALTVGGLSGGHSGIDIILQRANANILLARAIDHLGLHGHYRLNTITGGSAHNAIARDARAVCSFETKTPETLKKRIADFEATIRAEYAKEERGIFLRMDPIPPEEPVAPALSALDSETIINLLMALPHGVYRMLADTEGVVETSNNLATVTIEEQTAVILTSQRSAVPSRLDEITGKIQSIATLAGATTKEESAYPPWPPNRDSALLATCERTYRRLFGKPPVVEVIHAGLECAVIGDRFEGMDMISLGPDIRHPHSPDERLSVPTVGKVREFLVALLSSYGES